MKDSKMTHEPTACQNSSCPGSASEAVLVERTDSLHGWRFAPASLVLPPSLKMTSKRLAAKTNATVWLACEILVAIRRTLAVKTGWISPHPFTLF